MSKRIFAILLALALLLSLPLQAAAHDVPQERDDCSIELQVRYNGEDVTGGTLTAIRVGYVDEDDGNFFFSQEITGEKLEDISSAEAPGIQEKFYKENKATYAFYTQTQKVENGKVTFTGLTTGLYLVIQEEAAEGFHKLGAFLISVPYLQDGVYQYQVTAAVKLELEREPETEPTTPPPTEPEDPKLPQTGQLNWPIPLMAVAGLTLFIAGWLLRFGKKKEQYEK